MEMEKHIKSFSASVAILGLLVGLIVGVAVMPSVANAAHGGGHFFNFGNGSHSRGLGNLFILDGLFGSGRHGVRSIYGGGLFGRGGGHRGLGNLFILDSLFGR